MIANVVTPGERGYEKEEIRWRIDGSNDSFHASQLRKILLKALCDAVALDEKERKSAELWLGEATANAFGHSLKGGYVTIKLTVLPRRIHISISSPTTGYCGEDVHLPEKIDDEHGRGRVLMEDAEENLRKTVNVECNYHLKAKKRTVLEIKFSK